MDEDDDASKGINPNDIFKRENEKLPFFIDVSFTDFISFNLRSDGDSIGSQDQQSTTIEDSD